MKNLFILFLVLMITIVGCTDKFEDFNTDKKNPAKVDGNGLFTNAQKELADQVNETNVNLNNWRLWAQYWTETTYTDEANYDIVTRNVPYNVYRYFYRETLKDFQEAKMLIEEEVVPAGFEIDKSNRLAIIDLLEVCVYQRLVDIFGMAIYSDALDIENVYPKYDDGREIYLDLISRVNADLATLDASGGSFGSADLYYGGDVSKWIMFANTLKVRLGITIADSDNATAQTVIEQAVTAGCFASSADDCVIHYSSASPNQNPVYENLVKSGRDDFVPANTLVDYLSLIEDPRVDYYFENKLKVSFPINDEKVRQNDTLFANNPILLYYIDGSSKLESPDSILDVYSNDSVFGIIIPQADTILAPSYFKGGTYGYSSPFAQNSHVNSTITEPTFPGFILTFIELQFYLAEAAERGYSVGGTAEEFYNAGVTASFNFWGVADVATYLADADIAYSTAAGNWREKIGVQSWISNYPRGFVAYTTWRRLDYPKFNIAQQIKEYSEIPVRFTFPISEQTLNSDSYDAAAAAIGGDELTTKIFWDVNDSPFAK